MRLENPFGKALRSVFGSITKMEWRFPFLHNVIAAAIMFVVVALVLVLYPTIGVLMMFADMFAQLIRDMAQEARGKSPAEQFGYFVVIGIYGLLFLAFALFPLPFYLVGLVMKKITDAKPE